MREEIKHLSIDEYVHMGKFMLPQCIYRIQYEHKQRKSDSSLFFFGTAFGRQSASQIKVSLFCGCLADPMQRPG